MVHPALIAHLSLATKKKWSSSQSVNYYVYVSAQILHTKDPVLKSLDDCLAS